MRVPSSLSPRLETSNLAFPPHLIPACHSRRSADALPPLHRLVGFGQEICRPTAPRCDLCDVATARLCPSRRVVPVKSPAKKKLKVELKEEEVKDAGEPELEMKLEVAVEAEAEEVKKEEEVAAGEKEPTRDGAVRRLQEGLLGSADEVVKTA